VGKLSGGTALNIVPHHAEMDFEFRHLACDSIKATTQQLQEAAAGTVAPYQGEFAQTDIEIDLVNAYPGLALSDDMDFVGFAKAMAQTNETTKVAFGTEAGVFFDVLDIPTVVCGPGDMQGQGHQPDEYVEMDQLIACNAMLGRVLGSISS
jgi:acetylornithine deacetylase